MTEKTVNTSIEILSKVYPIRCLEAEVKLLEQAANFLNEKMLEVQDSGKAINLERIAIITALNIARQFLQINQDKTTLVNKINQNILHLQSKLDGVINKTLPLTELVYSAEEV